MKAAERIAFYAERFPVVELDVTARFPPTPELARQWAERTPEGFLIDVQAWSLLTGAAAFPDSLWADLQDEVRPEARDRRRLYAGHLSGDGRREAWARFRHALEPLRVAGRLGLVVLRYPPWLPPGGTASSLLAEARHRLADLALAAELAHPRWLDDDHREATLAHLGELDVALVCTDGPAGPGVVAATSDVAVVRMVGRGADDPGDYRYERAELAGWVPPVLALAEGTTQVHVLFANTVGDRAVTNAAEFDGLVNPGGAHGPG